MLSKSAWKQKSYPSIKNKNISTKHVLISKIKFSQKLLQNFAGCWLMLKSRAKKSIESLVFKLFRNRKTLLRFYVVSRFASEAMEPIAWQQHPL